MAPNTRTIVRTGSQSKRKAEQSCVRVLVPKKISVSAEHFRASELLPFLITPKLLPIVLTPKRAGVVWLLLFDPKSSKTKLLHPCDLCGVCDDLPFFHIFTYKL